MDQCHNQVAVASRIPSQGVSDAWESRSASHATKPLHPNWEQTHCASLTCSHHSTIRDMAVAALETIEDAKLGGILKNLEIPKGFKDYDELTEPETVVRLEEWRRRTFAVLEGLKAGLRERESYKVAQQGDIVGAIAPLVEERPWTTEYTRVAAKGTRPITYFLNAMLTTTSQKSSHHTTPQTSLSSNTA